MSPILDRTGIDGKIGGRTESGDVWGERCMGQSALHVFPAAAAD